MTGGPDPTTRHRDLDLSPLEQGTRLRARIRAAAGNNRLVIGATIGMLLFLPAFLALVALLTAVALGMVATTLGTVGVLLLVVAMGAYVLFDALHQARVAGGLAGFAEVNDLAFIQGTSRRSYAGSLFADGSHLVDQAVRTREEAFVEIGDRFPVGLPPTTDDANEPELYLRARLTVRVPGGRGPRDLVTDELHERLTRLAGDYTVEVSWAELTVFGSRPLGATEPGRVAEAFALADALVSRVEVLAGPSRARADRGAGPAPTTSGIPEPTTEWKDDEERRRTPRALAVVAATLVLVLGLPLLIAVVMSQLDRGTASVVVFFVIAGVSGVVTLFVRVSTTGRPRSR